METLRSDRSRQTEELGKPGLVELSQDESTSFSPKQNMPDYGMPQWLAGIDHVLSPLHLERLILGRHKFNHYRVWYRDALACYVRETLMDPRSLSRPYIQRKTLETVVQGHLKGDQNYTNEIHNVLTLELLHRLFMDQN